LLFMVDTFVYNRKIDDLASVLQIIYYLCKYCNMNMSKTKLVTYLTLGYIQTTNVINSI